MITPSCLQRKGITHGEEWVGDKAEERMREVTGHERKGGGDVGVFTLF